MNDLELLKRIKTLADTGLLYAENEFDQERYEELLDISMKLMSSLSGHNWQKLKDFYLPVEDYPTPKVDVRGLVLNDRNEILMVRELSDGKWAMPGGWCEVGFTPSEVIEKEIKEETGLETKAIRLLAVFDKKCHPHPPEPWYVYKLNFLCEMTGGELEKGFDIGDVGFFPVDQLPPLSLNRNVEGQVRRLFDLANSLELPPYCD